MIDSNIPYLLGAGSGVDTKRLVEQLVSVEKSVRQGQIDTKRENFETRLSDYGLFKSALSTLQGALASLKNPETYNAKSVSFPDSDVVIPTAIEAGAASGTYSIEVTNIASSQSLSSSDFTDVTDEVGKGVLTFDFGAWDTGLPPSVFTQNTDKSSVQITIDDSNNSLEGLRDAINDANMGVQASIVNDGSGYRLLMKAESGLNNQLRISAAEDETIPTNNDATGLSRFSFNETALQLTQQQQGRDANLLMNGLAVTRTTNEISDLIEGFTFTIAKDAPGEVVNINILDDKASAEESIRGFVEVYNEFLTATRNLTGFNEESGEYGSLARDALAKSMLTKIKNTITQPVSGNNGVLNALTNIGVRTELDGSMSIDETVFREAFADNFPAIQGLFAPVMESSADKIKVTGFGNDTIAGDYDVVITQAPEKGYLTGGVVPGFPVTTTGKDYSLALEVNGVTSGTISLASGQTFTTGEELAAALQQAINSDTALSANKVKVSFDTDHMVITSEAFGASSLVAISAVGADAGDLGLSVAAGTNGKDVVGTVNGEDAFGLADVLLPAFGSNGYGLKLRILPGATTGTVSFSRGVGDTLDQLVADFLGSQGPVRTREDGINKELTELDDAQEKLDRRMEAYQARLQAQFTAMEAIVDQLNNTRDYLEGAFENMPFTAKRR